MSMIKTIEPISRWETIAEIYENCECMQEHCDGSAEKCERCDSYTINYAELVEIIKKMPTIATTKVTQNGNNCTCINNVGTLNL